MKWQNNCCIWKNYEIPKEEKQVFKIQFVRQCRNQVELQTALLSIFILKIFR